MEKSAKAKASQAFILIKEIRDGVIIFEDGSMRMILMASSLNFALKSSEEQEAIINQYQEFLNSLDFSLQFFIQSRRLNIEPYLESLRVAEKKQFNELLKIQIREYIEFVKNFVSLTEIVSKAFYVVISYIPSAFGAKPDGGKIFGPEVAGILEKFSGSGKKTKTPKGEFQKDEFEEYKSQIQQRTEAVSQGLARSSIRAVLLNTEELIELFYNLYNPGEIGKGSMMSLQEK